MKIALCWNGPVRLAASSVRYDLYAHAFSRLGHDVITICTADAASGYHLPVHTVRSAAEFTDSELYASLGIDVVVMVTWLHMNEELAAARAAGCRTVGLADSDGQIGVRVHARHQLYRMVTQHTSRRRRIAAIKFFVERFLFLARREAERTIESVSNCDVLVFHSIAAATLFSKFLAAWGRTDLGARLWTAPYPVDQLFCERPVPSGKTGGVVAIGRWQDPQKDAPLLASTLEQFYRAGGRAESHVFGAGGETVIASLGSSRSNVHYHGVQPPERVVDVLRSARVLLITSRWESGPIVASEALCQGMTIVSAPLPNIEWICRDGSFGRVAAARSAGALTTALVDELRDWDSGHRNPAAIAESWRNVCSADAVSRSLLAAVCAGRPPMPAATTARPR
jgi:glycosyltransferase involved in cell wall biosynthesis